MKIAESVSNPLPDYFDCDLANISSFDLKRLKADALKDKISLESKFAVLHADVCLLLGLYLGIYNRCSDYDDMTTLIAFFNECYPENSKKVESFFKSGYLAGDCERQVAIGLQDLLTNEISVGLALLEGTWKKRGDDAFNTDAWIESDAFKALSGNVGSCIKKEGSAFVWIKKQAKQLERSIDKAEYASFKEGLIRVFKKKIKPQALEIYEENLIQRVLLDGCCYKKNDLIDALILECLEIKEIEAIISFDGGIIKTLGRYSEKRPKYIRSLELIESLR